MLVDQDTNEIYIPLNDMVEEQMTDSREVEGDTDMVNWEVVQPTTGAQYFHLLRRQMVRPWRKPLVVVAPKTLLRLPAAASSLADISSGSSFQTVISDPAIKAPEKVETVILVSGRHYYTLAKHIEEAARFRNAKKWIWSQEEHRNQGAWSFVKPRVSSLLGIDLKYAGRAELCQPAVGVGQVHRREADQLLEDTFFLRQTII